MSASSAALATPRVDTYLDPRSIRILRYAVGSTLAMAVAMGFEWQLSFLTPVLSLSFLASPAGRPGFKAGIGFVGMVAVACLVGLFVSGALLSYPLVYVPFAGLMLFHLFYAQWNGKSPLLIVWLMLAILLIPFISIQSPGLAELVAKGLVMGAAATMIIVWLAFTLFPDPPAPPVQAAKASKPELPAAEKFRNAALSTLVVFPVVVAFYVFQWTGAILVMIMIALLSMQPAFAKDFKAGKALILGNVIGGAAAIVVYELLVLTPLYSFLIVLTLLAGLLFGVRLFSDRPTAALYGMAFSTLLLIIGSTTSSTGEAGAKVYTRILQIMMAVVYVVVAFGLLERLWPRRET